MTGDRFNYYLKTIMNASLEDYAIISEQLGNDFQLNEEETGELDRLIGIYLSIHNKGTIRVVNAETGKEEIPSKIKEDDFGGTSNYQGEISAYGLKWKVYTPAKGYDKTSIARWYYNEKISNVLNDALAPVIPGKLKNYFDLPPWVLGTVHAVDSYYLPVSDIINLAIARKVILGWDTLIEMGIPKNYIAVIRTKDLGKLT
ncbi:MAG: hypothetical protein ACYDAO_01335 [Thermoplasmataceae archaeon]